MIGFWSIVNFTFCQKNKNLKCFLQMAGKHSTFFLQKDSRCYDKWLRVDKWQGLVNSYVYYGKSVKK